MALHKTSAIPARESRSWHLDQDEAVAQAVIAVVSLIVIVCLDLQLSIAAI